MLKHSCGTEIFFNYFMLMEFHKLNSATIAKLKYIKSCFHGPHSKFSTRIHKQTLCLRRLFEQKVQYILRGRKLSGVECREEGGPQRGDTAARTSRNDRSSAGALVAGALKGPINTQRALNQLTGPSHNLV